MSLLDFRKPKCVVLKTTQSYSGKYKLFYGYHYVKGKTCYDVGTINASNGEIVTRHYLDEGKGDPKAEALRTFDSYSKALTRKPESEEKDENNPWIANEFRKQLKQGFN